MLPLMIPRSLIIGSAGSLMLVRFGWRLVFLTCGAYGLVWALIWFYKFMNQNPGVINISNGTNKANKANSPLFKSRKVDPIVPWGTLLSKPAMWCVQATI